MLPPDYAEDSKLPVTAWAIEKAFDSAQGCENFKTAKAREWRSYYDSAKADGVDAQGLHVLGRLQTRTLNGRCVPSEHIYPPKK
jgi:hypothetical protein